MRLLSNVRLRYLHTSNFSSASVMRSQINLSLQPYSGTYHLAGRSVSLRRRATLLHLASSQTRMRHRGRSVQLDGIFRDTFK